MGFFHAFLRPSALADGPAPIHKIIKAGIFAFASPPSSP
jgi:hypothetical protein